MTNVQIWGALALLTAAVLATVGFAVLTMIRVARTVGDGVRSEIAVLGAKLGGEIESLGGKLGGEIEALRGSVDSTNTRIDAMNEVFASKFGEVDRRFESVERRLDKLDQRFSGPDRGAAALTSEVMGPEGT